MLHSGIKAKTGICFTSMLPVLGTETENLDMVWLQVYSFLSVSGYHQDQALKVDG